MRTYEATFIFRSDEEQFNLGKEFITSELEKAKIKILKEEDMGDRVLAYPIKKEERGHYFFYEMEANPDSLFPIEKAFKLKSEILKFLFILKNK